MTSQAPPPPPPLPAWVLALPPPQPSPPYNIPSRPTFPSRRQRINRPQEQKKSKASLIKLSGRLLIQPLNPFPFLELPREIRIMVYKYLVPNTKPNEWRGVPQRHDGPCYPEILSVCRSIHEEALDVFYNISVYLEIDISNNGIFFLGQRYLLKAPLPSTVRLAQSMCARIQLEWRPVRQQDFKKRISEIFPADNRLRNLQIYFQATSPAYIGRAATPEIVVSALDNTLSPLQDVAKDLGTHFHINFEKHVHQGRFSLGVDLNEVVRGYFQGHEHQ